MLTLDQLIKGIIWRNWVILLPKKTTICITPFFFPFTVLTVTGLMLEKIRTNHQPTSISQRLDFDGGHSIITYLKLGCN